MKRKLALLLSAIMLVSVFAVACTPAVAPLDIAVNIGPDPDTIDPALNSAVDGGTLIIHAFEGLYSLGKDGVPVPGQAASVAISADGLTYTFTLRDGLKWSDGKALTAKDFIYSWNRAIAPETAADYEYMFEAIKGYSDGKLDVTAPDDKTLVVTLNAVTPYFLELTAFPAFCPVREDIVTASPEGWATKVETYIGNGPFKVSEWVPGSHITMVRNENYWNSKALGPTSIKFVLMEDDVAILNAYKNGDIIFADTIPNDEITAWENSPEFYKQGQLGTYYISFNTSKAPLDNKLVREALSCH